VRLEARWIIQHTERGLAKERRQVAESFNAHWKLQTCFSSNGGASSISLTVIRVTSDRIAAHPSLEPLQLVFKGVGQSVIQDGPGARLKFAGLGLAQGVLGQEEFVG